ncbi:hypothetical protein AHAS_Ahas02G0210400 [Arachis hypogaea]
MTWPRNRVLHILAEIAPNTLRQYVRCYLMILIGGFLFTDKFATPSCHRGSALFYHTYNSLRTAAGRDVSDIVGCIPLLVSWIYDIFSCFSLIGYNVVRVHL